MTFVKTIYTAFLILFTTTSLMAQNPLVTHIYTADPTARVFDDILYIYPSHDVEGCTEDQGSNGFCMPDYHIFSTTDMINYKDHGVALDQNDVPWGAKDKFGMWAPDCIKKGSKYYYYYPGIPADKSAFRRIGVGVSDNPTGPFSWEKNYIKGIQGIDPNPFVDDDGKAYIYYGGGKGTGALKVARLKDNMTEIQGQPENIIGIPEEGYREASFMFKREGIYYFSWGRVNQNNYEIEYATSNNPMGPFKFQGVIMPNIDNGTNHHSIVEYKGKWYLFYHYWSLSNHNRLRSMRADEIVFNKNGSIVPKVATLRGIGTPKAGDLIQLDRYNDLVNAKISLLKDQPTKGWQIDYIKEYGWVQFDNVLFEKGKQNKLTARVASGSKGGIMEIRVDNPRGLLLAKVQVENTGGWDSWKEITVPFVNQTKGVKNIFVTFKGSKGYLYNIDWIKFE
ncbi:MULTISPECIES: family 43 glycosylhydrolase [Aquimarina]|uniref:family 43 glycosylhydrolase n=1 Tax=Aquimarina TaxID=290174 RepID=UPI000D69CD84|nr:MULTISPECIES: family 43 glycosylhydrolase [Aquimarina]